MDYNEIVIGNNCTYFICGTNGTISVLKNVDNCNDFCVYYEWSSWSSCPLCSLGPVYQNRTRQSGRIFNLNITCTDKIQKKECDIPTCSCINGYNCPCVLSEWSSWSSCSKSCGLGTKSRVRTYTSTGVNCLYENLIETHDCNPECCPSNIFNLEMFSF